MTMKNSLEVPIYQKQNLTIEEAAVYSNIGRNKLRQLTDDEKCVFVLWVGEKRLIKRKQFDEFIEKAYSI
jgi:excisionase family DNA binding protein